MDRTKWYESIEEMLEDLDAFLKYYYNHEWSHQGRGMDGRTPYQVFWEGLQIESGEDKGEKQATIAGLEKLDRWIMGETALE